LQRRLAAGEYRLLVRAVSGSRLFIDGKIVATTDFVSKNAEGHEAVPRGGALGSRRPAALGDRTSRADRHGSLDWGTHRFELQILIGSDGLRHEIGQPCVAIAAPGTMSFQLLTGDDDPSIALTNDGWREFEASEARSLDSIESRQPPSVRGK